VPKTKGMRRTWQSRRIAFAEAEESWTGRPERMVRQEPCARSELIPVDNRTRTTVRYRWMHWAFSADPEGVCLPYGSRLFCFRYAAHPFSRSRTFALGTIQNRFSDKIVARTVA